MYVDSYTLRHLKSPTIFYVVCACVCTGKISHPLCIQLLRIMIITCIIFLYFIGTMYHLLYLLCTDFLPPVLVSYCASHLLYRFLHFTQASSEVVLFFEDLLSDIPFTRVSSCLVSIGSVPPRWASDCPISSECIPPPSIAIASVVKCMIYTCSTHSVRRYTMT